MAEPKTFKFPKKLGSCADKLYRLKTSRLAAQKIVDGLEEEEKALKAHIIDTLPKSEASGVAGRLVRVSISKKDVPQVKDWVKFRAYVKKHNAFDLLQKRLSSKAILDRLDDGKKIPGVEMFTAVSVSMNKI